LGGFGFDKPPWRPGRQGLLDLFRDGIYVDPLKGNTDEDGSESNPCKRLEKTVNGLIRIIV
jgi:hypothetical protein